MLENNSQNRKTASNVYYNERIHILLPNKKLEMSVNANLTAKKDSFSIRCLH